MILRHRAIRCKTKFWKIKFPKNFLATNLLKGSIFGQKSLFWAIKLTFYMFSSFWWLRVGDFRHTFDFPGLALQKVSGSKIPSIFPSKVFPWFMSKMAPKKSGFSVASLFLLMMKKCCILLWKKIWVKFLGENFVLAKTDFQVISSTFDQHKIFTLGPGPPRVPRVPPEGSI